MGMYWFGQREPVQDLRAHRIPRLAVGQLARGSPQRCDGVAYTSRIRNALRSCSSTHTT